MLGSIYYIYVQKRKTNTAGVKAPDDIAKLCALRDYHPFTMPGFPTEKSKIYQKFWLFIVSNYYWRKLVKKIKKDDIIIYQHPMYGNRIIKRFIPQIHKKGCKLVALIHDLESLRGGIKDVITTAASTTKIADAMLPEFDFVICHNEHMKKYLISHGCEEKRLFNLDLFDYLNENTEKRTMPLKKASIAIAGNLAIGKSGYIYKICSNNKNPHLEINLYGINYQKEFESGNMIWHGSFKPDELPQYLQGSFGLVWDGDSVETCSGNTGNYLRYNNPHKTSLYLAAGMPVIVWSQAAVADFVIKNRCGLVVDDLCNLEKTIDDLSEDEYREFCHNAEVISGKVRSGSYFYGVLDKVLNQSE